MTRPYRAPLLLAMVVVLAWTLVVALEPLAVRGAIDHGVAAADVETTILWAGGLAALASAAYGLKAVQITLISWLAEHFLRDVRIALFNHLQALSMGFHDRQRTGVLVSRMTTDIDAMTTLAQSGLVPLVSGLPLVLVSLVVLCLISVPLTLALLVAVAPLALFSIAYVRWARPLFAAVQDAKASMLTAAQELFVGIRAVKLNGAEPRMEGHFRDHNAAVFDATRRELRASCAYYGIVESAGPAVIAFILVATGLFLVEGAGSVAVLAAFVVSIGNFTAPLQELSSVLQTAQMAQAGLGNILTVLSTGSTVPVDERAVSLPRRGRLVLEGVSFGYVPERPVLRDVRLSIEEGERVALVGPTGGGKSSLAKLAARLYDPDVGSIRFGDVDLRRASMSSLRERIVILPQETYLFAGTVRDNIRLVRPEAADADVLRALERIGVSPDGLSLTNGLDTEVDSRGSRLSLGQRQLISLARVALTDPAVVILDEATANVDPATELEVERAMTKLVAGRTVIVIAHRLGTAIRSDRIVVVDAGAIAEAGSHRELLAAGGRYAALHDNWFADQVAVSTYGPNRPSSQADPSGGA